MIPRRVTFWWIFLLTRRGTILRGDWLAGLSFPREIDSLGYHSPGRWKNLNNSANSKPKLNFCYTIGQGQIGSNYTQKLEVENLVGLSRTVPLSCPVAELAERGGERGWRAAGGGCSGGELLSPRGEGGHHPRLQVRWHSLLPPPPPTSVSDPELDLDSGVFRFQGLKKNLMLHHHKIISLFKTLPVPTVYLSIDFLWWKNLIIIK